MAKQKPKTRITLKIGQTEKELMSIRELPSGDLTVLVRTGDGHDHPNGTIRDTMNFRISIHCSPATKGNTIVFHQEAKDGSEIKQSAFVHNTDTGFAWHLVSKKCQSYLAGKYSATIRKNDKVIQVGHHDPDQSTVLYSVFVTDSHRDLPPLPDLVDPYTKVSFRKFTIYFLVRYLAMPSLDKGTYITTPTSAPQVDGSAAKNQCYTESVPFGLLAFEAHRIFVQLCELALRHVNLIIGSSAEDFARGKTLLIHA